MPFDVDGAKAAGYSDDDIAGYLSQKRGFDLGGAKKAGYTTPEILDHLYKSEGVPQVVSAEVPKSSPFGKIEKAPAKVPQPSISDLIAKIAVNTGKAAIGGAEAIGQQVGGVADFFVSNSIAGLAGLAKVSEVQSKKMGKYGGKDYTPTAQDKAASSFEEATKTIERVKSAVSPYIVYQPRTAAGKRASELIGSLYNLFIGTPSQIAGETAQDVTRAVAGPTAAAAGGAGASAGIELFANIVMFKGLGQLSGGVIDKLSNNKSLTLKEQASLERSLISIEKQLKQEAPIKAVMERLDQYKKEVTQKSLPDVGTPDTPAVPVTPTGKVVPPDIALPIKTIKGERAYNPMSNETGAVGANIDELIREQAVRKARQEEAPRRIEAAFGEAGWVEALRKNGVTSAQDIIEAQIKDKVGNKVRAAVGLKDKYPERAKQYIEEAQANARKIASTGDPTALDIIDKELKPLDAMGAVRPKAIADKLDIIYNGVQSGTRNVPDYYLFTDKKTGTTFNISTLSEKAVAEKLAAKRAEFAKAASPYTSTAISTIVDSHAKNGDSSVSQAGHALTDGYAVSMKGYEKVLDKAELTPEDVSQYIAEHHDVLKKHPDAFVGTWVDSGKSYLDISRTFKDEAKAQHEAALANQKAYFDLKAGQSIYMPEENKVVDFNRLLENNASGESAASAEAISRNKTTKFFAVDERTGKVRPLLGVDSVDQRVGPYEVKAQVKDGQVTILDRGERTTGRQEASLPTRVMDAFRKTVGNEHGAIDIAEVKKKLGEFYTGWKEFWTPFSSVPEREGLLLERGKAQGEVSKVERKLAVYTKQIDKFDLDTRTTMFRVLDGQLPINVLPQEAQALTRVIIERTNRIGQMLVDRGIITQDTFDAHKGQYVHHVVGKYLADRNTLAPTVKRDLGYAKARKDLSYDELLDKGLIDDAGVAVPAGMGKALMDIARHDYLQTIANNPEWVWPKSIINIDGKNWTVGKLVGEVEVYRRMVEKFPENIHVKDRLMALDNALQKASKSMGSVPKDYVQLPDTPGYGPLAGAFVRKSIADDLMPLYSSVMAENQSAAVKTVLKVEAETMAMFKVAKTGLNFPTAFRNMVSNMVQINMSGIPLQEVPESLIKGVTSLKAKDRFWRDSEKYGLFKTNWSVTEINDVLNELMSVDRGNFNSLLGAIKNLAKYYGKIDDLSKLAIFRNLREKGISVEQAVLEAQKWGMDYSLAPRSIKELRKHALPFISYQYKIAPLLYEAMTKRPHVLAKYAAIPYVMSKVVPALHDIDTEEWKRIMRQLPSYIRNEGSYMVMPTKDEHGHWRWVNLEYYFPWGNWLGLARDVARGEARETIKDTGFGNPLLDIAYIFKSTQKGEPPVNPFNNQPIYNKLDDPATQWAKVAEFLYTKWGPGMLSRQGALGGTISATTGKKTKWGETVTPGEAFGKWFGWNTIRINPAQVAAERQSKLRSLDQSLKQVLSQPGLTQEERQGYIQRYRKQYKAVASGTD